MKDFYLDLSSESVLYENSAESFKCSIQPYIELNGEWEVAVTEIVLPRVKNIRFGEVTTTTGGRSKIYKIPDDYYATPAQLLDVFRALRITGVGFRYDEKSQKAWISVTAGIEVTLDENLTSILGLEQKKYTTTTIGVNTVDMFRTIKPMLLKTDLIEPQVFGEIRRPVLRAIYTESPHIEFAPKYLPVIGKQLSDIHFHLSDINNRLHEFLPGSVNLTLHFRKCNRVSQGTIKEPQRRKYSHY